MGYKSSTGTLTNPQRSVPERERHRSLQRQRATFAAPLGVDQNGVTIVRVHIFIIILYYIIYYILYYIILYYIILLYYVIYYSTRQNYGKKKRFNLQAPPVYDRKVTNLFFP